MTLFYRCTGEIITKDANETLNEAEQTIETLDEENFLGQCMSLSHYTGMSSSPHVPSITVHGALYRDVLLTTCSQYYYTRGTIQACPPHHIFEQKWSDKMQNI